MWYNSYTQPLYRIIAGLTEARENCRKAGNTEWYEKHGIRLARIASNLLPHGGGFDNGTQIDTIKSKPSMIVLDTAFHHMTDGLYDGWTGHTVIVRASLVHVLDIRVTGRDRNEIKEHIHETFFHALTQEYEPAKA
jgi:hypothetical protein